MTDIVEALDKCGLDPREQLQAFSFDPNVRTIGDLREGMTLPGIVTNITAFGAFVDIGIKQDGLVHISQMADRYVASPAEVVHLGQQVEVRVTGIDTARGGFRSRCANKAGSERARTGRRFDAHRVADGRPGKGNAGPECPCIFCLQFVH